MMGCKYVCSCPHFDRGVTTYKVLPSFKRGAKVNGHLKRIRVFDSRSNDYSDTVLCSV